MSLVTDLTNLIFLFAAIVGGGFAFYFHNRYTGIAERLTRLEADLHGREDREGALKDELAQRRKEIDRLTALAASAGVERARLEAAQQIEPARSAKGDKKKVNEKLQRDTQRLRELEAQIDEARRQLESAQKLIKTRDADVRHLKDEIESLQVALAENRPAPQPPALELEDDEAEPRPAARAAAPATAAPEVDIDALVEARMVEAKQRMDAADRTVREAQGRANLAELETRRTQERLTRLDKRSHELLDRLIATERDYRKVQRQVQDYQRMYLGLKGRFEVARDTLVSFRDRFGVEIPTEVGVPQYGMLDDFLEYDEEEDRSRPRGERPSRRGSARSGGPENIDPPAVAPEASSAQVPAVIEGTGGETTQHEA